MKALILFCISLTPLILLSQNILLGSYCRLQKGIVVNNKYCDDWIKINSNNKFEFGSTLNEIISAGYGTYLNIKDTLILNFEKYQPISENKVEIIQTTESSSDSIIISFQVFNKDTIPYAFVNAYISTSINPDKVSIIATSTGDHEGKGKIIIKKDTNQAYLNFLYPGTNHIIYKLTKNKNYKLFGYLFDNFPYRIEKKVWKFLIEKKRKEGIQLIRIGCDNNLLNQVYVKE
jgi:hypothetical protein